MFENGPWHPLNLATLITTDKNNLWNNYCSNGEFIVAMLLQENSDFRVVRFYKSDGRVNINCGFRVVAHELR